MMVLTLKDGEGILFSLPDGTEVSMRAKTVFTDERRYRRFAGSNGYDGQDAWEYHHDDDTCMAVVNLHTPGRPNRVGVVAPMAVKITRLKGAAQ